MKRIGTEWSEMIVYFILFSTVTSNAITGLLCVALLLLYCSDLSWAGQLCASCSAMTNQDSCQHYIKCEDYEKCYMRNYETESADNLYDMGCMAHSECPHSMAAVVGKRGEGHHVICEACCNNASMCNQMLSCDSIHNQGPIYPRDCADLNIQEKINNTYTIYPYGVRHRPVSVYCIFDYAGVAWTAIQRRFDGSVNFYRDWRDYTAGFGQTNGEYWLGLEHIHALTSIPNFELKVVLTDFENVTKHATYASFHVDSAANYYRLTVYGYTGTAGDSLGVQNGMMFSTFDRDHDTHSANCAVRFKGGWWYSNCHSSNLNGQYLSGNHTSYADGIEWGLWHGYYYSLKSTVMIIRKT